MIPRILHHIWLTPNPLKQPELRLSFMHCNPKWSFLMWGREEIERDGELRPEVKKMCLDESIPYIARSDLLRYEVVYRYGGVYADTDVLCIKPLDALLDTKGFTGEAWDGEMSNSLYGCVKEYPPLGDMIFKIFERLMEYAAAPDKYHYIDFCGVKFHAEYLKKFDVIHPQHFFYPFSWRDLGGRNKLWPDSYTAHQWHGMDPDGWPKTVR